MARDPLPVNPAPRAARSAPGALRAALLALAVAAPLGGCAIFGAPEEQRGNRVDADQLREITPGVQTKADVAALLGSPSTTSTFDQEHWYYISATTHVRPGQTPGIGNERVVAITFDGRGVVTGIRELGERDMRDVAVVQRQTPVPGNDRSLLQALFGNIGRFGAGGMSVPTGPGQSSAPAP